MSHGKLVNKDPHQVMDVYVLVQAFKSEIEEKLNKKFNNFMITTSSCVADQHGGKHYYIKVHFGGDNFVDVRIHESNAGHFGLDKVEFDKRDNDLDTTFVGN